MTPDMFRKLAALGLSHEQMAGVLEIFEADAETRKEKARTRVQRWRDKKRDETQRNVTEHNETQQAGSCEGVTRGEDNLQTKKISGQEEKKDTSPPARSKRGERIPENFVPDIEAAVAEGLPRQEAERQARSFCDYWRSKPGKDGLKLDWQATWRVWYRRNLSRPPSHRSADPPQRGVMGAARRILESEGNGSESIFGNLGDGEFLPPTGCAGQRDASADIPSPFAGLRLVGHS
jgi:hypothetical protein